MRKNGIKLIAFVLAAVLASTPAFSTSVLAFSNKVSTDVSVATEETGEGSEIDADYNHMTTQVFDTATFDKIVAKMKKLIAKDEVDEKTFTKLYQQLIEQLTWLDTDYALVDVKYYQDVNDEESSDQLAKMDEINENVYDEAYQILRDSLKSSYKDVCSKLIDDEDIENDLLEYQDMTDAEKKVEKRLMKLQDDYNTYSTKNYEVEYNGETYSMDNVDDLYYSLSVDEYYDVLSQLFKKMNDDVVPVYQEMVTLNNQKAKKYGYDNYAEYAYAEIYGRDFTTEDTKKLYEYVKQYVVPTLSDIQNQVSYDYDYAVNDLHYSNADEAWDAIQPALEKIDPSLADCMQFMRDNHLYDIDASSDKMSGMAFTTGIPAYNAAFIFSSPQENYHDYSTLVHEFGHYYSALHSEYNPIANGSNMDVLEIDSQGLELLALDEADQIYGSDNAKLMKEITIYYILDAIVEGCMYDEFQVAVYEDGDMNAEEMNSLFAQLAQEYGIDSDDSYGDYYKYGWVQVSHTFQSPMYYISYATSALTAFDLFSESIDDRQGAIDTYMNISSAKQGAAYCKTVEECGLRDVFEDGTVPDIMVDIKDYVSSLNDQDTGESYGQEDDDIIEVEDDMDELISDLIQAFEEIANEADINPGIVNAIATSSIVFIGFILLAIICFTVLFILAIIGIIALIVKLCTKKQNDGLKKQVIKGHKDNHDYY